MKTKKQCKNKKKRPRAKKRVIIFDSHKDTGKGNKTYFRWNFGTSREPEYPEKTYSITDLITGEVLNIVSLDGRSLMERCHEKQGIYIINVHKQKKTERYIPSTLKPKALMKAKLEYPEFLL